MAVSIEKMYSAVIPLRLSDESDLEIVRKMIFLFGSSRLRNYHNMFLLSKVFYQKYGLSGTTAEFGCTEEQRGLSHETFFDTGIAEN